MTKALILASVASMIEQFNRANIQLLQTLGCEVHVIANFTESGTIPVSRSREFMRELRNSGVTVFDVAIKRSPFAKENIAAYQVIKHIMQEEQYHLVHCQSPIGGILGRLAARKNQVPNVLYTAHGFHFYRGAPLKNWLLYYPVEKLLGNATDYLITINHEDYMLATKRRMFKKDIFHVPGIGVDRAALLTEDTIDWRTKIREELNLAPDALVLIYIAEINANKNQTKLIEMLARLHNWRPDAKLLLVGAETDTGKSRQFAKNIGMEQHVIFTGWRGDIQTLLRAADICVASSIREGFGLNLVEAMTCGLPVVAFDNRGHREIVDSGWNGYLVEQNNVTDMIQKIKMIIEGDYTTYSKNAIESSQQYGQEIINQKMREIYQEIMKR